MHSENQGFRSQMLERIGKKTNTIGIELTHYCPLDCVYCSRRYMEDKNSEMPFEQFLKLKEVIKEYERVVICGIGEPMAYSRIYDVIRELKDKRLILITSGTIKMDMSRLNQYKNIEVISFSIDAPTPEDMKTITGLYNWDHLMHNLTTSKNIIKIINCTVNPYNINRLEDLARFAVRYHMAAVNFSMAIDHEDKAEDLRQQTLDVMTSVKKILKRGHVVYTDSFRSLKCAAWNNITPYITLDGSYYPCCHGLNCQYKIGNVFEESMEEVWMKEKYLEFREGNLCFDGCPLMLNKAYKEGVLL